MKRQELRRLYDDLGFQIEKNTFPVLVDKIYHSAL